jgi:hypothetical protein
MMLNIKEIRFFGKIGFLSASSKKFDFIVFQENNLLRNEVSVKNRKALQKTLKVERSSTKLRDLFF